MSRLADAYLRLATGLPPESMQRLAHVADRLCCGERNARLQLARMQAAGWLRWTPGRGRGRLSRLALLQAAEAPRLAQRQALLAAGRLEEAFSGLPAPARAEVADAMPGHLGAAPGGGLRIPFYRPLHALDPIQVQRRTEAHIVSQLCDGLTTYALDREAVAPALAHHWQADASGLHWRFWLRPGLTFHDGRPVTTDDAVRSLRRLRDTPGPHRPLFAHVKRLAASGDRIDIQLASVDHLLPNRLAHHAAAILPADDWRRPDFASRPVGTGAFSLRRNNDHRATLARFDGHWRERALLAEIDLWVVPAGSPMPAVDLRLGQAASVPAPMRRGGDWRRLTQAEEGCDFVLLNPSRGAFASTATRVAIGAWLRGRVARTALGPAHTLATGWLPRWQHLGAPASQGPAPSLARDVRLPRRLRLVTYQLDAHRQLAACVAAAFAERGVQVDVDVLPFPVFERLAWRDDADLVVSGEVYYDDLEMGQFTTLASDPLVHAWLPAGVRRWLARACTAIAAEPVFARRAAAMEVAFARLVREGAVLPMRHALQRLEHAPGVGGVSLARCGWMDFRRLWLAGSGAGATQ